MRTTGVPAAGQPRLRGLDGLRFVAAMAVVLFHYTGRDSPAWGDSVRTVFPTLSRVTLYGGFGSYLFFMISGFVVLMSAEGRSVPSFLASRVGRLYPAYWVAVLGTAAVVLPFQQLIPVWPNLHLSGVALNLTMLQSAFGVGHVDGVYWTLWVELKFYVLLALLLLAGITRGRLLLLCAVWPVLGALAATTSSPLLVQLLEPTCAPFFCLGILLYLVRRDGWSPVVGLLLGLDYLAALSVSTGYYVDWSAGVAGAPTSPLGMTVLLTLCVAAVAAVTLTPLAGLRWRWLTLAGALTYPLYLVHEFPGWVLLHVLGPVLPAYPAVATVIAAALLVAWAVHRLVERPLGPRLRRAVERDLTRALTRYPTRTPVPRHEQAHPPTAPVPRVPSREPAGEVAQNAVRHSRDRSPAT